MLEGVAGTPLFLFLLYHSTSEAYYIRKEKKMRMADYGVTKAVLDRHGFTFKVLRTKLLTDTNILQNYGYVDKHCHRNRGRNRC